MVQVTLTGLGVLLILASWQFMVLPSLTDECRDVLRSLKARTESFFEGRTDRDASAVKRTLLGLLDSEIENVHKISLIKVAIVDALQKQDPKASKEMSRAMEAKFESNNAQIAEFVSNVRKESAQAIAWYIARRHLSLWIAAILFVPLVIVHVSMKRLSDVLNEAMRQVLRHGAKVMGARPGKVQQKIEESFIRLDVEQREKTHRFA